jgi:2-amino-4-hydroxy-6-hydroxymethyldihydropteridine diphosphokinase
VAPSAPPAGSATEPGPCGARVAVALGSNLGERRATLDAAVAALHALVDGLTVSSYHDTQPQGVPGPQPRYLNAAVAGTTRLSPRALLDALQALERRLGRERPFHGAPRTLDLDLILYGDRVAEEAGLILPHPRFRERAFVLDPLVEVAPDLVDPVTGLTARALQAALPRGPDGG